MSPNHNPIIQIEQYTKYCANVDTVILICFQCVYWKRHYWWISVLSETCYLVLNSFKSWDFFELALLRLLKIIIVLMIHDRRYSNVSNWKVWLVFKSRMPLCVVSVWIPKSLLFLLVPLICPIRSSIQHYTLVSTYTCHTY